MAENVPKNPGFLLPLTFLEVGTEQQLDFLRDWAAQALERRFFWACIGRRNTVGQGSDAAYQGIVDKALTRTQCPPLFSTPLVSTGRDPLLLDVGTEEDRQRYIKNILTGDEIWCQGFSEPDHGSDLGNVQTKAVRDGDEYIVNGSKIWTTLGNYADHMILLARTDNTTARKYDGLSFFLSPMRVQGVEARPIRKVTGEYGFNETFFTDARIPAACLLGDEGGGWRMAMKTLEYERGVIAGQASAHSMQSIGLEDLMDAMQDFERDGAPILQDAMIRDELVKLAIEAKANSISDRRAAIPALNTDHPFGIALSNKYRHTEYARRLKMMGAHVQGPQGALFMDDDQSYKGGFWQRAYFANFGTTIGGGTTQIQANIIGEHVLGLPKS